MLAFLFEEEVLKTLNSVWWPFFKAKCRESYNTDLMDVWG